MMRRLFLLTVLGMALLSGLHAGDLATFINLGFSADSRVFMFAQYGADTSLVPYAELFMVNVPENRFVPGGVFKSTALKPIQAGQDSIGALFPLIINAGELVKKHKIDSLQQGRLLYILVNGESTKPRLEFRDFETDTTFRIKILQNSTGTGADVRSSFHIECEIIKADGSTTSWKVGSPDFMRSGVAEYRIKQIIASPDNRALVFVVERDEPGSAEMNVRYMVETLRLP